MLPQLVANILIAAASTALVAAGFAVMVSEEDQTALFQTLLDAGSVRIQGQDGYLNSLTLGELRGQIFTDGYGAYRGIEG